MKISLSFSGPGLRLSVILYATGALALLAMAAAPVHGQDTYPPTWSQAVKFIETRPLREVAPVQLTPEQLAKFASIREEREKNEENTRRVKAPQLLSKVLPFIDPAINNSKLPQPTAVTAPLASFDGPDMDGVSTLFGGRFAPPDTNGAVGPNHFVATVNSAVQVFTKTGTSLAGPVRISTLLTGITNAGDDDGDPIVLYDALADRWIISQFNLRVTGGSTHEHVAVSKTGDPTGAYYAYDFLLTANRPGDYPHMGVWPDGYYFSTNDFTNPPFVDPLQGAGLYALERDKMLIGDPTALIIRFNTTNAHSGMLPSNFQGFTPPPVGTPNLFFEFDADEFGAAMDLIRPFVFHADFDTPANSTLTQGPDIATAAFDARQPATLAVMQQPAPSAAGDSLDPIADRLMHPLNFRVLSGGVQSYVLNFTVNVSGVNPTNSATYQGGVRWLELRRDATTGIVTINQDATYAPGSGNPTGRDLWMASVAQDNEGNIALAASATNSTATPALLNPTALYTGRLSADPLNTLPQSEVDVLASAVVTGGVQTGTANRWGDYSSLFVDPADDCTFWGAFEYVDAPTASFDWNTRIFSFKVNPTCSSPAQGTITGTITNCASGLPIQNAIITTPEGFLRQTNASGAYSMAVPPGTYTVSGNGPPGAGYGSCTQTVTVTNGGTTVVNCCLAPVPIMASAGATLVAEDCSPANGTIDPDETVTVSFCLQNTGAADTANLVATLQATGGVTNQSGPQNYGVVIAGGAPVCRNFTFKASGACGGTLTATLQLQDGANDLGTVTYTFTLGAQTVVFQENFDGVTAPALPAGWVTAFTNGDGDCTVGGALCALGTQWATETGTSDTAPNAAFHNDPSCVTDNTLDTPAFAVTSTAAQVSFRNNFNTESTFDGAVLEVSSPNINAGAFTDITNAAVGGSFVSGGYNGTISMSFLSPIAGRPAWTGNSAGYISSVANLGPNVAGQTIQLRFRMGSDCNLSATGWRVDTVRVTDGFLCCVGPSMANPTLTTTASSATTTGSPISDSATLAGGFVPTGTVTFNLFGPDDTSCGGAPAFTSTASVSGNGTYGSGNFPPSTPGVYRWVATYSGDANNNPVAGACNDANESVTVGVPPAQPVNLSTRMRVETGDSIGIGGFIITGNVPKGVIIRAIGPALMNFGLTGLLADPVLELHGPSGFSTVTNDNWRDTQETEIAATGIPPTNDSESAIVANLAPGAYTALVRGKNGTTGLALVEVYDLDPSGAAQLANISTRAFVNTGNNIVIAGFILGQNSADDSVVVRGIGPSLTALGVPNALANPSLELRDSNGSLILSNNDWQDNPAQAMAISGAGLAPTNALESAIFATLPPGAYTALLTGLNGGLGVGLVEIYQIGTPP